MADGPLASDDARLAELLEVIVALAGNELGRRAFVGDGDSVLDGIATGINMLAEELAHQQRLEREHNERAQRTERLALVGQLAARVAHDINTPASYVLANLSTLDEQLAVIERWTSVASPPDDVLSALRETREVARDGITGIERIESIVRDLRALTRRGEGVREPLALVDVVEDARRLASKDILYRARLVVEQAGEPTVRGDRASLTQALANLLVHAAQSIPEGNPSAHHVTISTEVERGRALVRVVDSGRGLSEEEVATIFEPLVAAQAPESGDRLGLLVAREIVHEHGGTLGFESVLARGSTLVMRLPALEPAPAVAVESSLPRVLMIDDEPMVLDAFTRLLRRQCELVTAGGGAQAIALLTADRRWDLVVCDMMMPQVDGTAVHAWVAEHAPELLRVFVFCTGGAFTARATSFLAGYGGRVLDKPLRRQAVLDAIEAVRR